MEVNGGGHTFFFGCWKRSSLSVLIWGSDSRQVNRRIEILV